MPKLEIDISDKTADGLQPLVQRTNITNRTNHTLKEWIHLHLKELAIADRLSITVQLLQQEQQEANDTLQAAVRAARDQLLKDL